MLKALRQALFSSIPLVAVVLVATFFLVRWIPGGPFDLDRSVPPQVMENMERRWGLHRSLPEQFWNWSAGFLRGDLGESMQYAGERVGDLLWQSAGPSVTIGLWALAWALLFGVGGGLLWGSRSGRPWRVALFVIETLGASLPPFVLAVLLAFLFARTLGWLPAAQFEHPLSFLLPSLVLAFRPGCQILSLVHREVQDQLRSVSIRAAFSRGFSRPQVLSRHVLPLVLPAVLGLVGPIAANLVTGSVVVETVFQIPGLGKFFVSSVLNRDYTTLMGITWVYSLALVITSTLAELALYWLDPRQREVL